MPSRSPVPLSGFLVRLARDARGNALMIMAAMLIPLAAFSGSAIDTARLWTVKTRLQQACDAGVLAGRRSMTLAGSDTTLDTSDTGQAQTFFKNNFNQGWFKTSSVRFTPTLDTSNSHVDGTAVATVPMTLMTMFGQPSRTITVTCEAQYDVADADIMFVLDTTGSMACTPGMNQSDCDSYAVKNVVKNSDNTYSVAELTGSTAATKSRIQNLREAVASFYTTLTSLQKDPNVHFRFGFVPYSATVNMGLDSNGGLLPRSYLATSTWNYQTRVEAPEVASGQPTIKSTSSVSQSDCTAKGGKTYSTNASANPPYTATVVTPTWTASSPGSKTGTCSASSQVYTVSFNYGQQTLNIGSYVNTFGTGNTVANPSAIDGDLSNWNGCIEERSTSVTSSPSATSPPLDLDVDTVPYDEPSRWGPMWGDLIYAHSSANTTETSGSYRTTLTRFQFGGAFGTYELASSFNELPCPRQAQPLKTMTLSDIQSYLSASSGFRPYGNTYHDVGMTWGTRLLASKNMFIPNPVSWPGHNPPNRYLIFLTDGLMETDPYAYTSHGLEMWDKRVAGGATSSLTSYHSARFATACKIARDNNHQVKIYLIAYASSITSLSPEMQNCANKSYTATDTAGLNAAFTDIAQQVAMLRLAK